MVRQNKAGNAGLVHDQYECRYLRKERKARAEGKTSPVLTLEEAVDGFEVWARGMRSDAFDRGPRAHVRRATEVDGDHRREMDEFNIPEGEVLEFKPRSAPPGQFAEKFTGMLARKKLGLSVWPIVTPSPSPFLVELAADYGLEVRSA